MGIRPFRGRYDSEMVFIDNTRRESKDDFRAKVGYGARTILYHSFSPCPIFSLAEANRLSNFTQGNKGLVKYINYLNRAEYILVSHTVH